MTLVGYDRELAASNGYEIRTTSTGQEYSVPVGAPPDYGAPSSDASTQSIVYGDCGSSFVYLTGDRLKPRMSTGFTVRGNVAWRKWGVTVSAPRVNWDFNLDGGPSGASWSDSRTPSGVAGYTTARVNPGSYVALWDGGICTSGLPGAYRTY